MTPHERQIPDQPIVDTHPQVEPIANNSEPKPAYVNIPIPTPPPFGVNRRLLTFFHVIPSWTASRKIDCVHLHEEAIDFVVFWADGSGYDVGERVHFVFDLIPLARQAGLRVRHATLARWVPSGIQLFGTTDLPRYLGRRRLRWLKNVLGEE